MDISGPGEFCGLECVKVAQAWKFIQHNGIVTIWEIHAIVAAAGMSNGGAVLVMCKNSMLLSDPCSFSAQAVTR